MHQAQNRTASAVFKAALQRDVHARAVDVIAAPPANASTPQLEASHASECIGCGSYMLPVLLRKSMSQRLSATLQPPQLPRQGDFNRASACVALRVLPV
jgi:hypothetical protein